MILEPYFYWTRSNRGAEFLRLVCRACDRTTVIELQRKKGSRGFSLRTTNQAMLVKKKHLQSDKHQANVLLEKLADEG